MSDHHWRVGAICALLIWTLVWDQVSAPRAARADSAGGAESRSAVIFDNMVPNDGLNAAGATPASQIDRVFPFDAGAADDFVLPASPLCTWSVTGVTWTGLYWEDVNPGALTGFRIVFYEDAEGLPATTNGLTPSLDRALAVYDLDGRAGESPAAAGGAGAFAYSADLPSPLELRPGVRYWIQLQAVMPYPPQWGWHVTQGRQGLGPVKYFDLLRLPPWMPIADPGDLAFQLLGEAKAVTCDDGDLCTQDTCVAGECVFTAVTCDDGDPCTVDACDPAFGCSAVPMLCDDQNACTDDACAGGECVFTAITCDDGNPCTHDTCVAGSCVASSPADADGDGDVDLVDYGPHHACLTGVLVTPLDAACDCSDLTGNGTVDLRDFAIFQIEFTGAN